MKNLGSWMAQIKSLSKSLQKDERFGTVTTTIPKTYDDGRIMTTKLLT